MAKYCPDCGSENKDGTKFCENCGKALPPDAAQAGPRTEPQPEDAGAASPVSTGFSERLNDPEILAAAKKNRKAARIFAMILVPLPLIAAVIYGIVSEKTDLKQALIGGAFVSVVFLVFAVISFVKTRTAKRYDAVVIEKKSRQRSDNNENNTSYYTEYVTIVRTDEGKKKKIVERDSGGMTAYDYLNIGDRFRYHPQFNFPYELYDKTKAPYLVCVSCGKRNAVENDRCSKCNIPLLK